MATLEEMVKQPEISAAATPKPQGLTLRQLLESMIDAQTRHSAVPPPKGRRWPGMGTRSK